MLRGEWWTFSEKIYNALPTLEHAHARLATLRAPFDEFVQAASAAMQRADLDGQLAALLLHRHWRLKKGYLMIERARVRQSGRLALVTAGSPAAIAFRRGAVPNRWAVQAGSQQMLALEFSVDPFVVEMNLLFGKRPEVLPTLADLATKFGLEEHIGFMIVPRKSLVTQTFSDLVEENFRGGLSIVTPANLSPLERLGYVKTGWPLAGSRRGSIWIPYCSHGPGHSCKHKTPDPPVCHPHGCV